MGGVTIWSRCLLEITPEEEEMRYHAIIGRLPTVPISLPSRMTWNTTSYQETREEFE